MKNEINISIIDKEDGSLTLLLENVPVSVANSIRRAIISYVPTLAIDKVIIFRNDSIMNDDILAHRLGLIPLKYPIDKYVNGNESVTLTLKVKAKDEYRIVTSNDIKSSDPDVYPLSKDIEIVKLAPGEGIEVEMEAVLGRGNNHAKWSPVTVAVVRGVPVIELPSEGCGDECVKCVDACPKNILERVDDGVTIKDIYKCTVCGLCMEACPERIKVDINEDSSILYFESVGQIDPEKIFVMAIDELLVMLDRIHEGVMRLGGSDVEAQQ